MGRRSRPIRATNIALQEIVLEIGKQEEAVGFEFGNAILNRRSNRKCPDEDVVEVEVLFADVVNVGRWYVKVLDANGHFIRKWRLKKKRKTTNTYTSIVFHLPQDTPLTVRLST